MSALRLASLRVRALAIGDVPVTTWFFVITIVLTPAGDMKGATDAIHVGGFTSQAQCETVRAKTMVQTTKLTSKMECREEPKDSAR